MFSHVPLERCEIIRLDSPEGRKYEIPSGEKFESVTTWLGRTSDDSWLEEWRKNIGADEADKITRRAAGRGTRLHENAERFLKNENVDILQMPIFDRMLYTPFASHLKEHVNEIRAIECPLYSKALRLAGTVDCVANYDGVLSIVDFKTSKSRKSKEEISNYFIQTSIYSYMIEEMYGLKADKLVIVMAIDYEKYVQVFEEKRKNWSKLLVESLKQFPPK